MTKFGGSIILASVLAVGLSGCTQDGAPSVPAGSDGKKAEYTPEKTKAGPRAPAVAD